MSIQAPIRAVLALVLFPLAGCGPESAPDYWGAVPTEEMLTAPRPPTFATLKARRSPFPAAQAVDEFVSHALDLVVDITSHVTPELDESSVQWRTVPGASEPLVWRFTVENTSRNWSGSVLFGKPVKPAQSWRYRLEAKPKMARDSSFRVVLDGTRETPEGDDNAVLGTGAFRADWRVLCGLESRRDRCGDSWRWKSVDMRFTVSPDGGEKYSAELLGVTPSTGGEIRGVTKLSGAVDARGAGTLEVLTDADDNALPGDLSRYSWGPSGAGRGAWSSWTILEDRPRLQRGEQCWDAIGEGWYSAETEGPWAGTRTGDVSVCPADVAPPAQP